MKSRPMPEIPYTVRPAPELLERIEKTARDRGIAPRKLIRAVLAEHFAGDRGAPQDGSASQSNPQRGLDQILFDLTRTRLTPQHLLDRQVSSEATESDPPDRPTGSRALHAAAQENN